MPQRARAAVKSAALPSPIKVNVVRSTEAIDVDAWLDRYVTAILEAEGYPTSPQAEVA